MTDRINIALAHGFSFTRDCNCASRAKIYKKGKNELFIFYDTPQFKLKRVGNNITVGNAEIMEHTLTTLGL